jgi:hypothetical protein
LQCEAKRTVSNFAAVPQSDSWQKMPSFEEKRKFHYFIQICILLVIEILTVR